MPKSTKWSIRKKRTVNNLQFSLVDALMSGCMRIIDFGATCHMTFNSRLVSSLKPFPQKFVSTTNVVPSLDCNLLSVSQITTTLFCVVIFCLEFYVFMDIQIKQTIGCGTRRGKLYYLDLESKSSNKLHQSLIVNSYDREKNKSSIWFFRCDVCELATSHHASFPLILNKSPISFMVIHFYVWSPSKVTTLGGLHWFVTFIDYCTRMT
ncbi:hypothetical protein CR513_04076, partial [Mucuna pruriens]